MAIETVKYIRKPLYVDAVQITPQNFEAVASWCQGEVLEEGADHGQSVGKKYIKVRVHNPKNVRQTKAFVGDWLLYTERGYKVYTNKAFHASFDKVEDSSEPIIPDEPYDPPTDQAETPPKDEQMPSEPAGVVDTEVPVMPLTSSTVATTPEAVEEIDGKRVLTRQEQIEMSADELRDLLRSGEVVLQQDLAKS